MAFTGLGGLGLLGFEAARRTRIGAPDDVVPDFEVDVVEDMIGTGASDASGVRVWVRVSRPGPHTLEIWRDGQADRARSFVVDLSPPPDADGTTSFRYPDDVDGGAPLEPLTRYRYRLLRDGEGLGEGAFETAPASAEEAPETCAFAVVSCHQPFDRRGDVDERSLAQLRVLEGAFEELGVKRVLLLGDQMYTDYPEPLSLFDPRYFQRVAPPGRSSIFECSREEVRAILQLRYRIFWNVEPFRRLQARFPCHLMLDDHELFDNFGSAPVHATRRWAAIRQGGLDAFWDYQALRTRPRTPTRPDACPFGFTYGSLACYVLDLRSQKQADGERIRIVGPEQLDDLRDFLDANVDKEVMLLGLSVPLVMTPDWMPSAGAWAFGEHSDMADRWAHHKATGDRDRLLAILEAHQRRCPHQRLVLLGGDVHVGAVTRLRWKDRSLPPMYQLVSSAVSNLENRAMRWAAQQLVRIGTVTEVGNGVCCEAELLRGEKGATHNPFPGLNAGVVQVVRTPEGPKVRLLLLSHTRGRQPRHRIVFDSGLL